MIDKIILGLLNIRSLTSYDIQKSMKQSINFFYSSSLGSINPTLKKLHTQHLVDFDEQMENGRAKKLYHISPQGKEAYIKWLNSPITTGRIKEDALIKLFFLGDTSTENQLELIGNYLNELKQTQEALRMIKENTLSKTIGPDIKEKAKFQLFTLQFGLDYYEFAATWFSQLYKELKLNKS